MIKCIVHIWEKRIIFLFNNLFTDLLLALLGLHCCAGFSPVAVNRGCCLDVAPRLRTAAAFHCGTDSGSRGLQQLQHRALEHRLELWCTGLAALRHVRASHVRDRTWISCTRRRILYRGATREARELNSLFIKYFCLGIEWLSFSSVIQVTFMSLGKVL